MKLLKEVFQTLKTKLWWSVTLLVMVTVMEVTSLSGPNVCMVKQKYNITKRVKYRAPMSVRTYEWCFAVPPRCSKWNTEMRDVTRLETEERTAEMAVCCPGYKLKDVSCVPICPNGKTGQGCSEDCPPNKWGPNCVHDCKRCEHGVCDSVTGDCRCQDGWQGESCETSMKTTAAVAMMEQLLTTARTIASTKTTESTTPHIPPTTSSVVTTSSTTTSSTTFSPIITPVASTTINVFSTEEEASTLPTTSATATTTISKISETLPTVKSEQTNSVTFSNNDMLSSTVFNTYKIVSEDDNKSRVLATLNSKFDRKEPPQGSSTVTNVVSTQPVTVSDTQTTTQWTTYKPMLKETISTQITTNKPISKETISTQTTTAMTNFKETMQTTFKETAMTTVKYEMKKQETTVKQPTTTKFKPKEIWIRPAQKGDSSIIENKYKPSQEIPLTKYKLKDVSETTTPKTIIVSIIPTSVSYVTFKRLALSTAPSISQKNSVISKKSSYKSTEQPLTKPMEMVTTETPTTVRIISRKMSMSPTISPEHFPNVTKTTSYLKSTRKPIKSTVDTNQMTNSMTSTLNVANKKLTFSSLTTTISSFPTNVTRPTTKSFYAPKISTSEMPMSAHIENSTPFMTEKSWPEHVSVHKSNITDKIYTTEKPVTSLSPNVTLTLLKKIERSKAHAKTNLAKSNTSNVTVGPSKDEETFHILTEPEHITAVMGDKETERSTIDLISVISIAGGVMMAIITVAVVIVMLERCKKPRYEEVRKFNDIKMQVMIDNHDIPPPYVRSIFHTPLPDPPSSEKCHYQPISTLDRNLKQFMRPVVVQTISPLMLENFRGILECHYDHLPRRSQDIGAMETRCSITPSVDERTELIPHHRGHSLTDSDIEALKCEAKLDVIDNTTSEPLYAEIPCWRPPSAHAIEVVNLNGEAVTEL